MSNPKILIAILTLLTVSFAGTASASVDSERLVDVQGNDDAEGVIAISGNGDADGSLFGLSGTGHAKGLVCVDHGRVRTLCHEEPMMS